jgi:hypothetical protein
MATMNGIFRKLNSSKKKITRFQHACKMSGVGTKQKTRQVRSTCPNAQIPKYPNTQISGYQNIKLPRESREERREGGVFFIFHFRHSYVSF